MGTYAIGESSLQLEECQVDDDSYCWRVPLNQRKKSAGKTSFPVISLLSADHLTTNDLSTHLLPQPKAHSKAHSKALPKVLPPSHEHHQRRICGPIQYPLRPISRTSSFRPKSPEHKCFSHTHRCTSRRLRPNACLSHSTCQQLDTKLLPPTLV